MQGVNTIEDTIVKGHVPVQMRFQAQAIAWRALHVRGPPRTPSDRIVGPLPPPPFYGKVIQGVRNARRVDGGGNRAMAQASLDDAYAVWADLVEVELAHATDFPPPPKSGERNPMPYVSWRSILPERNQRANEDTVPWAALLAESRRIACDALRMGSQSIEGGCNQDVDDECDNGSDLEEEEFNLATWGVICASGSRCWRSKQEVTRG